VGTGTGGAERGNPDLILTRISAFGQTGPMAARPGFAAVAEAFGGFRELVGDPDRPPVRVGVSIGDTIAGLYAAFGSVMSLFEREVKRGKVPIPLTHRMMDIALNEAMLSVTESLIPDHSAFGIQRQRTGGRMEGIAPSNAYLCIDGSIVVAGNGDAIFRRYMDAIARPDLAADPRLQTNADRWEQRDELDDAIGQWAKNLTTKEALAVLDSAGVPAGPIYTAADIVADDQYAARDMVQRFDVSTGAETIRNVAFPGIIPVIGGKSLPIRNLGPDLGADTKNVLERVLGKTAKQADSLIARMEMETV
jgi:formyl-CoA transferase